MNDRERDRNRILNPDDWPHWPLLALKRNNLDIGLLIETLEGVQFTVYEGNVFNVPTMPQEKASYETVDELLDAGWRVD